MSEIVIERFLDVKLLPELREIFFESSSKKEFRDEDEREAFYWKYMGFYLANYPSWVFIARNERVKGYCLGTPTTTNDFCELQPHLRIFAPHFLGFSAHFHINCEANSRGQGLGGQLLQRFEIALKEINIAGVHLMTGPDARNRFFYQRLGYTHEVELPYEGKNILMMGKDLRK